MSVQTKLLDNFRPRRLTPRERAEAFSRRFPQYAPLVVHNNRLYGTWVIGALYRRRTGYYGEYPHTVLERILALFPDCGRRLHLFSGVVDDPGAITYDINPELRPTICDDVRNIKKYAHIFREVDLVIADPPYEERDFKVYGQAPFNKPQVIRDLGEIMPPGSYLAWLDVTVPMYSKKVWSLLGHIGLIVSTNTRVRMWTLLERVKGGGRT
jgi:hypothetical protein